MFLPMLWIRSQLVVIYIPGQFFFFWISIVIYVHGVSVEVVFSMKSQSIVDRYMACGHLLEKG